MHMKWLCRTSPKSCDLVYGWEESVNGALVVKGEAYHIATGPNAHRVIDDLIARYGDKKPSDLKLTPCANARGSRRRADDTPLLISATDYQRALGTADSPRAQSVTLADRQQKG